ncbi:MAG: succinyl-diaminopimelate desuccinylase [Acidimicrobiia bacterium]
MSVTSDTGRLLIDTLGRLVDISSETGNEGRIATTLAARLLPGHGEHAVRRVGQSLVVGAPTGGRELVLLVGHLDTVPSQGQGPARIEGDRMYGLGTADMKGGLAVMVHLLDDPEVRAGPYDVVGVFYDGEEGPAEGNGLEPTLERVDWLSTATFAVVLEPSDRQIQLGCNGVVNARVGFRGTAAHSARPWWGENAITKAGEWLAAMHRLEPEPVVIDGLEFREVMSVTRASGGVASNIIPAEFTLNLNYRFSPLRSVEEAVDEIRRRCEVADEVTIVDAAPAGPVDAGHPFVDRLRRASGSPLASKQGWTDVARLGVWGIPAVNFGPGETSQAHTPGESVALEDLEYVYRSLQAVLAGRQGPRPTVAS